MLRSVGFQAKQDANKDEEAKKESKEKDSVLDDVETYCDSESAGNSGEASQRILNSIGGLLS